MELGWPVGMEKLYTDAAKIGGKTCEFAHNLIASRLRQILLSEFYLSALVTSIEPHGRMSNWQIIENELRM